MDWVRDPRSVHGKTASYADDLDVLVVGGGPAGIAAAETVRAAGLSVQLVDEHPLNPALIGTDVPFHFGSRYGQEVNNTRDLVQTMASGYEAAFEAGVDIQLATTCLALYVNGPSLGWLPGNLALLESRGQTSMVRFRKAIVAAGCRDFALAFPGWETPGVMGAAAAQVLLQRYAALNARSISILGSGIEALAMARLAQAAGLRVAAVIEVGERLRGGDPIREELAQRNVPVLTGMIPLGVDANLDGVIALHVGTQDGIRRQTIQCDTVINAIGSVPVVELLSAAGATIRHDRHAGGSVPLLTDTFETTLPGIYAVGDCAGVWSGKTRDPDVARREARIAAGSIVGLHEVPAGQRAFGETSVVGDPRAEWVAALRAVTTGVHVCQCEEVTADDICRTNPPQYVRRPAGPETGLARLASTGALLQDQVKRITRAGMGLCQARRCREQVAEIIARELGRDVAESGVPNSRAPVRPVPLSALADTEETNDLRDNWVSWLGIPNQYKPYWEVPMKATGRPRGSVSAGADVVIIGGGVSGMSTAWWLGRQGIRALVLEASVLGNEASGRNGGGSAAFHSPLFPEAEALWPQLDELLGYPTEYRPSRLKILRNEAQRTALAASIANARHIGSRVDELDPKQVADLAPLAGPDTLGGVYFHGGGHMNPQRTLHAYAWAAENLGARILQRTTATGVRVEGGRVVEVHTNRGSFGCDAIVVAAGPQTAVVCDWLGARVPVASARAEMVLTEPLPLMPCVNVDGNGLYGRQTLRGNLAYGGGPHEWLDDAATHGLPKSGSPLIRNIAARIAEMLPLAAHAKVIRSWAGFIECTPDGRPIIDHVPDIENAVVITMSSVGFGLSPATGRAVMELLRDGYCSFADIGMFSLSRFVGLSPNWREEQGWVTTSRDAVRPSVVLAEG